MIELLLLLKVTTWVLLVEACPMLWVRVCCPLCPWLMALLKLETTPLLMSNPHLQLRALNLFL